MGSVMAARAQPARAKQFGPGFATVGVVFDEENIRAAAIGLPIE